MYWLARAHSLFSLLIPIITSTPPLPLFVMSVCPYCGAATCYPTCLPTAHASAYSQKREEGRETTRSNACTHLSATCSNACTHLSDGEQRSRSMLSLVSISGEERGERREEREDKKISCVVDWSTIQEFRKYKSSTSFLIVWKNTIVGNTQ